MLDKSKAKKITPEVLRSNPFLASLIRQRAREVSNLQKAKANSSPAT